MHTLLQNDIEPADALLRTNQGPCGLASLHIRLRPIKVDGEEVPTSIRLDQIEGLGDDLNSLSERSFVFPTNPAKGYIDGSLYVGGRHHQLDVVALVFHARQDAMIPVHVRGTLHIEGHPVGANVPISMVAPVHLPLSEQQIHATVLTAITAVGARWPSVVSSHKCRWITRLSGCSARREEES